MAKSTKTATLLPTLDYASPLAKRNRNLTVEQLAAIRRKVRAERKAFDARRK